MKKTKLEMLEMTAGYRSLLGKALLPLGITFCGISLCLASGCTKNEETTNPSATTTQAAHEESQATPAATSAGTPTGTTAAAGGPTQTLSLGTDGNNLYFNQKSLDVKAGSKIQLTFTNNATADSGLTHNWVLTKPGTADQVASAGMQAGDANGWIPNSPDIIAHSKLLKSGESDTVTFTAPPAGDYPYLCSFPGHASTMKGVLHSK